MAKWRRPPFALLALLALLALAMPSFVWACPITGRTGDATTVCDRSAGGQTAAVTTCCAQTQNSQCLNTCCHSVPQLPGSDTNKNTALAQAHADTASVLTHLSKAAHAVLTTCALPAAPLAVEPPQGLAFPDVSATLLLARHTPAASAGRAPPLS